MREQPWMKHVTHQMTELILGHKDACKSRLVLYFSQAKRIECAVRAVIKLYCTDVSCEWVSCLQIFSTLLRVSTTLASDGDASNLNYTTPSTVFYPPSQRWLFQAVGLRASNKHLSTLCRNRSRQSLYHPHGR